MNDEHYVRRRRQQQRPSLTFSLAWFDLVFCFVLWCLLHNDLHWTVIVSIRCLYACWCLWLAFFLSTLQSSFTHIQIKNSHNFKSLSNGMCYSVAVNVVVFFSPVETRFIRYFENRLGKDEHRNVYVEVCESINVHCVYFAALEHFCYHHFFYFDRKHRINFIDLLWCVLKNCIHTLWRQ